MTNTAKTVYFTIGATGAGKSTITSRELPNVTRLDSDEIKKTLPNYDPKNPSSVHEMSAAILQEKVAEAMKGEESFIIDGTGANSDRMVRQITEAKLNGFNTELIYVVVSLSTSLKRNAARERNVPESIVKSKYNDVNYSFNLVAPHADNVRVFNNDKDNK